MKNLFFIVLFFPACLLARTLSVNTGYFRTLTDNFSNSNMGFSFFWQEMHMIHGYLSQFMSHTWWGQRNTHILWAIDAPFNFWLGLVQYVNYYEYGHYSRYKAFGYNPHFGENGNFFTPLICPSIVKLTTDEFFRKINKSSFDIKILLKLIFFSFSSRNSNNFLFIF